jgi:predicted kinase
MGAGCSTKRRYEQIEKDESALREDRRRSRSAWPSAGHWARPFAHKTDVLEASPGEARPAQPDVASEAQEKKRVVQIQPGPAEVAREELPTPGSQPGEFVFVIGGIAAGKTSFVHDTLRHHSYLDIDTLQTHPRDWNAPPEVLEEFERGDAVAAHSKTMEWAIKRVAEWMDEKLELGTGDYVYMATGRRKDDLRDQMQRAKRSGYTVNLLLVKTSDEARLERNRERSRSLPDDRVVESGRQAAEAFAELAKYADSADEIDNDKFEPDLLGWSRTASREQKHRNPRIQTTSPDLSGTSSPSPSPTRGKLAAVAEKLEQLDASPRSSQESP